jgi:DNA-binding protein HU-beta
MNKQELTNEIAVAHYVGNKQDAEIAIIAVFTQITAALMRGEEVRISGFGTFKRVATKARICKNPHTGEAIEVPAGSKVKFKASSKLRA